MLATILEGSGREPGWVVGAAVAGLGRSAAWGGPGPLVVEADESDGPFLAVGGHEAGVNNLEADHLEHWGSAAALREAVEWKDTPPKYSQQCATLLAIFACQ